MGGSPIAARCSDVIPTVMNSSIDRSTVRREHAERAVPRIGEVDSELNQALEHRVQGDLGGEDQAGLDQTPVPARIEVLPAHRSSLAQVPPPASKDPRPITDGTSDPIACSGPDEDMGRLRRWDEMQVMERTSRQQESRALVATPGSRWLWLAMPISVLAIVASIVGILVDDIYAGETSNWSAQGIGQDIGNLVAFPVLVVLAYLANRGSLRAYLACVGVLAYSVYTYAIYAFDIHFGPLFLAYVAVFGLSIWALIGALTSLDAVRVKESFDGRVPVRSTSILLVLVGTAFSLLWLSEIVPSMLEGTKPGSLVDAGLATNPVHVLDLSLLLPSAIVAGLLLRRGHAWGYVLTPIVLGALVFLSIGIIAAMSVLAVRGEGGSLGVAGFLSVLAFLEVLVWVRFLRAVRPDHSSATARIEAWSR